MKPVSYRMTKLNDKSYPKRVRDVLGNKSPSILYFMGNADLLDRFGLGFCGSRNASPKGIETVGDCSEQAAQNDIVVISGYATGVDQEAHYTALKTGGATIIVLAEGINHFRIKKNLEDVWDWDRVLVVSQFEPEAPWKVFRAMTRNQLIIALSGAMVVIEAGEKGGTLNAGEETLRLKMPLYVAEYQDMSSEAKGNKLLLSRGGKVLAKSRSTNRANMSNLYEELKHSLIGRSAQAQWSLL